MTSPSRRLARMSPRMPRGWAVALVLASSAGLSPRVAPAQDAPAGVFDEEKPGGAKKADAGKPPGGDVKAGAASDRETIGFTQQNIAAQMAELEDRMFRLSEAL